MVKRGARPSSAEQRDERPSRPSASAPLPPLTRSGREPPPLRSAPVGSAEAEEARALGRDEQEAHLLEEFFSWPPPPAPDFGPERFERPPLSRGSRRAMWASILMLVASVLLIVGLDAYHRFVMPEPVELGEWSGADALLLPAPNVASDEHQAEAPYVRLGYASLQHDVSAIQEAENKAPEDTAPAPQVEPPPAPAEQADTVVAEPSAPAEIPPSFEARLALARQLLVEGELRQSLPLFERALELRANSVDALLGQASALFFLEDYEAAKSSAQQALAIDPRSHDGLMLVGSSFERLGDRAAAKSIYERCIDQAVDNTRCRERLTQVDAKP